MKHILGGAFATFVTVVVIWLFNQPRQQLHVVAEPSVDILQFHDAGTVPGVEIKATINSVTTQEVVVAEEVVTNAVSTVVTQAVTGPKTFTFRILPKLATGSVEGAQ